MRAGSSVLPFALAGSLCWCYCGDGGLIEGSRHFVDVVQSQEGENQTGKGKKARNNVLKKHVTHKQTSFNSIVEESACDLGPTHTMW